MDSNSPPLSGYYNSNVVVDTELGAVVQRSPIAGAEDMDLRTVDEFGIVSILAAEGLNVPRPLHRGRGEATYSYVSGEQLESLWPRHTPIPPEVLSNLAASIKALHSISIDRVEGCYRVAPPSDATDFSRRLRHHLEGIVSRAPSWYPDFWADFGIEVDPTSYVVDRKLDNRELHLLHCDIHRKNLIWDGSKCWLLDWEAAQIGDPAYEYAVIAHKMRLSEESLDRLLVACGVPVADGLWREDMDWYISLERIKSAVVDTQRYANAIDPGNETSVETWTGRLVEKLSPAFLEMGFAPPSLDAVRQSLLKNALT